MNEIVDDDDDDKILSEGATGKKNSIMQPKDEIFVRRKNSD